MINHELIRDFTEEAREHVETVEHALLCFDKKMDHTETVRDIFRAVHSIKGTAGFFGLDNIVALAHVMENFFGELRDLRIHYRPEMTDLLLLANDQLRQMVENVQESERQDIQAIVHGIQALLTEPELCTDSMPAPVSANELVKRVVEGGHEAAREKGEHVYRIKTRVNGDMTADDALGQKLCNQAESIGSLLRFSVAVQAQSYGQPETLFSMDVATILEKELLAFAFEVPESDITELEDPPVEIHGSQVGAVKSAFQGEAPADQRQEPQEDDQTVMTEGNGGTPVFLTEDSVRVNIKLLNELLDVAGEMVLNRNRLLRVVQGYSKDIPGLDAVLQNLDYTTTVLQEKILQTRMQPVANVFARFPRMIRDLSRKMTKEVTLFIEGNEVELDKSIIEALGDPLTHLLRNAVDHGIEYPVARELAGKNPTGAVRLSAYHESGNVNIDIADDGAGMDKERIRQKAVDQGLLNIDEAWACSERELLALIFRPGFSTADRITDVSGRGVGMDVVKTNIEKLGGTVEVYTILGQGTTFRLTLPLTVAIIPSLIVAAGGHKFALPQANVQEIIRIRPQDASRKLESLHHQKVLRLRNRLLPLVSLTDVLQLPPSPQSPDASIRILVLKNGSRRYGLIVDVIYDGEDILIKALSRYFRACEYYSGVTILGDGKIAMILDPEGIAAQAGLWFADDADAEGELERAAATCFEQQSLLQFQGPGSEYFAVDMTLISRVEEIKPEQIEQIGEQEYLQFRGDLLRLVRLENYLPVSALDITERKYYIIIPKSTKLVSGILARVLSDTVLTDVELLTERTRVNGILGTMVLNGRITMLLNLFELMEMADPELAAAKADCRRERNGDVILVVEDTPFFLKAISRYLEWMGYRILNAPEGQSALRIMQEQPVDLVLTDIVMPVMDGLELLKAIRRDGQWSTLPVIAMTSLNAASRARLCVDVGFDDCEPKDDILHLLNRIDLVLQSRRSG
ncbi:MAG TPA: chemotaxis protein CheW [Patescibacteria group bacterium]|nr:chemotaxis protein CheW [Patescibacteria group bacterium]